MGEPRDIHLASCRAYGSVYQGSRRSVWRIPMRLDMNRLSMLRHEHASGARRRWVEPSISRESHTERRVLGPAGLSGSEAYDRDMDEDLEGLDFSDSCVKHR